MYTEKEQVNSLLTTMVLIFNVNSFCEVIKKAIKRTIYLHINLTATFIILSFDPFSFKLFLFFTKIYSIELTNIKA